MPKEPSRRDSARNIEPADGRPRDLREQLQTAVNTNITKTVEDGIKGIDRLKKQAVDNLNRRGITNVEEIAESAADLFKKLLVRGISK